MTIDNSSLITLSSVLPEEAIILALEYALKGYKEAKTPEEKQIYKKELNVYSFLLLSKDITDKSGLTPALKSYEDVKKIVNLVRNPEKKEKEN